MLRGGVVPSLGHRSPSPCYSPPRAPSRTMASSSSDKPRRTPGGGGAVACDPEHPKMEPAPDALYMQIPRRSHP